MDIKEEAYRSEFHHQEYLKSLQEVLNVVDTERYARRSNRVGTIIVSQSVPASVNYQLQRLKTCYRLGLDEVSLVFCRAILEAALAEILRRRGILEGARGVVDARSHRFQQLVGLSDRHVLDSKLKEKAKRVGLLAGKILHSKERSPEDFSQEVHQAVRDTFEIIENLYA